MFIRLQNLLARSAFFSLTICCALLANTAVAGSASADNTAAEAKARNYFSNLEVVDQNGRRLNFYDDVLKD